ncbi:MAG: hypothetical protein H6543_04815 [Prevotellaceae bacterium]|nr:hypothetical protein [Prevotellaceae bacterium]
MVRTLLLVGSGGALGSICRYVLSILMNRWNMHTAWLLLLPMLLAV